MPRLWLIAGVLFCVLIAAAAYEERPRAAPCNGRCNVILIVIDTLSAQHIAAYGYDRDTMPKTTAFFENRGQIFDDVWSGAAWTFPSFAATYFSDEPSDVSFADYEGLTGRPQIFSALRNSGVNVLGIHLANDPKNGSFILDAVYGLVKPEEVVRPVPPKGPQLPQTLWTFAEHALFATATQANERSRGSAPFFSFTHLLTVHAPYEPEPPYDSLFASSTGPVDISMADLLAANASSSVSSSTIELYKLRYDQGIAETDALLGQFLDSLSTTTLSNTAIIITADHGEAFDEHGHFFHGLSVYSPEADVPLFIYVPGVAPKRIAQPVSLLDLAPTILALEGVRAPSSFRGASLVPTMLSEPSGGFALPLMQIENGYPFFLKETDLDPDVQSKAPITLKEAGAYGRTDAIISLNDWGGRVGDYKLTASIGTSTRFSFFNIRLDPSEEHPLLPQLLTEPQEELYLRLLTAFEAERAR